MKPRRWCALLIVLCATGCLPVSEPAPDVNFLYGGWVDSNGDKVRFRGIKTKLPNVPFATYVEGRFELLKGSERRVGVWNFGKTRPFIVLNVVPHEGGAEFWAIVENSPVSATAWVSRDPETFERPDWRQGLASRELRRLDSEWNPEPKLTSAEARIPPVAEVLN